MESDDKTKKKAKSGAGAPKAPKAYALDGAAPGGAIHRLLGMTPSQVREETRAQGIDPAAAVESMRRLGRVMAAKYGPQIEREAELSNIGALRAPIYEEAVAAGAPAWSGASDSRRSASLLDILGGADQKEVVWIRVAGWSMRDAGINDGDTLLVDARATPKDGDIVVAHLEGQGQVVKRLRLDGASWATLESANADFAPIVVSDASTLRIHGVVVGRAGRL